MRPRNILGLSRDPRHAAMQAGENARDVTEALESRLVGHYATVERYAARGDTDAKIHLFSRAGKRPRAVLLVNCYPVDNYAELVSTDTFRQFYWENGQINVHEPRDLEEDRVYTMTFLILE